MDLETFEILADAVYDFVAHKCINEVGVYRVPGSTDQAKEIFTMYQQKQQVDLNKIITDPFTATTLLKYAITQLKEQILPNSLYPILKAALLLKEQSGASPTNIINQYLDTIPAINQKVLTKFVQHMKIISLAKEQNQMTIANLLIVFGPSLLKGYNEQPLEEMKSNPAILKMLFDYVIETNGFNNLAANQEPVLFV